MDNQYLIPLIVTLVTAMTLGAIYLLMLLLRDGQPEAGKDDDDDDAESATEASGGQASH